MSLGKTTTRFLLITVGASTDKKLGLEGEDNEGVISAVYFLRNVGMGEGADLKGQNVAVIGGGNVAMDAGPHLCASGSKEGKLRIQKKDR